MIRVYALVALLSMSGALQAATIAVTPTDDRTIGDRDGNGISDSLAWRHDGFLRTGFYGTYWRSALEFDISAIPDAQNVDHATFFIRDRGSSRDGVLNVWGYAGDGRIRRSDAANTSVLLGTFHVDASKGTQDFRLNVTDFIASLHAAGERFAGILIGAATGSGFGGGASDLCSSEGGWACGYKPTLVIKASDAAPVPLPAGLPLALTGLAGLYWASRRAAARADMG